MNRGCCEEVTYSKPPRLTPMSLNRKQLLGTYCRLYDILCEQKHDLYKYATYALENKQNLQEQVWDSSVDTFSKSLKI